MRVRGQDDSGYAMAVLLVGMSVMAIMMTIAMPVWKQAAQREKEEELVFRGLQYVRALRLFSAKYANASPPTIDVLVEQRFLRKKYKDPITNDDFQPVLAGQAVPGVVNDSADRRGAGVVPPKVPAATSPFGGGIGGSAATQPQTASCGRSPGTSPIGTPGAGRGRRHHGRRQQEQREIHSSLQGRSHYNEWAFINTPQTQAPGAGRSRDRRARATRWARSGTKPVRQRHRRPWRHRQSRSAADRSRASRPGGPGRLRPPSRRASPSRSRRHSAGRPRAQPRPLLSLDVADGDAGNASDAPARLCVLLISVIAGFGRWLRGQWQQ